MLFTLLCCAACAPAPEDAVDGHIPGYGSSTPQDAATKFFDNLNEALNDTSLSQAPRQRYWADLLASSFTPAERADQRLLLGDMLARFTESTNRKLTDIATNAGRPITEYNLTLEVEKGDVVLVSQHENRASVRLVDGLLRLRVVQRTATQGEVVVLNSERPLAATLGLSDGLFPVARISGLWFMSATGEGQG